MSFDPAPPEVETDAQAHHKRQYHHREKWQPTSKLSRAEREEMKTLSRIVFKSSSKWQSLIDKGAMVKATKEVEEQVKNPDGTTSMIKKQVPIHDRHGKEYSFHKQYTIGELRTKMVELADQVKAIAEMAAKEKQAAAHTKIVEEATGTAL